MKILIIGDVISPVLYNSNLKDNPNFKDVELIISSGDLPFYYYDYIVSNLNVPLFYIFGNHTRLEDEIIDKEYKKNKKKKSMFVNLDNNVIIFKNLIIAGLEGSKKYNMEAHQYTENEMRAKILKLTPKLVYNKLKYGRYIDILVTHAPPFGFEKSDDLCHQGFKVFLNFIERFKPQYLIHGHIHIYDENQRKIRIYKSTKIINSYNYKLIEI